MSSSINTRFDLGTDVVNNISIPVEFEYTSAEMQAAFVAEMQKLQAVYNMSTTDFTAADKVALAANIKTAMTNLINLAKNGISSVSVPAKNGEPARMKTFYITHTMAMSLDTMMRTFAASGSSDPTTSLTAATLEKWKDLSIISPVIGDALTASLGVDHSRTLQAMIEVDYVSTGNNLINDKLSNLEQKLQVTQNIITSLTSLQSLRNNVTTPGTTVSSITTSAQITNLMPLPTTALINYNGALGAAALPTSLNTQGVTAFNQLLAMKTSLEGFLTQLSTLLPSGVNNENSMYGQIKTVLNDFKQLFVYPVPSGSSFNYIQVSGGSTSQQKAQALYTFLVDRQNPSLKQFIPPQTTSIGLSQTHLTAAITSCQSSNDQQKEDVRNALFVFEEFYKSASGILQKISQIIEKVASYTKGS